MSTKARLARGLMWPVRRLLDPRFADVGRRIDYARDELMGRIGVIGGANSEAMTFVGHRMRELEHQVTAAREATGPVFYAQRVEAAIGTPVEALDGVTARLVGFAEGHAGYAAQRNLWLNPPVTLAYQEGDVTLGSVNERIVELPFAFGAVGGLSAGARVLDVGSVESTVALSLASLGHDVTALDLRPYPFEHPELGVAVARIEDFAAPAEGYDAILCISTLEHVGLGWYGEQALAEGADRAALERLGGMLAPGGILVLTVPYGAHASRDAVQRTYDAPSLDALLDGWSVQRREVVEQRDERTWVRLGDDGTLEPGRRAVALVLAAGPA